MASVVTVGSAVLDHVYVLSNLPAPDGGAFVTDRTRRGGGVAANVACGLSALDHNAAVVSRVGDDDAADIVVESVREWDVDADAVRRGDGASSYTLILRGPDGGRMIVAGGDSVPTLRLRDPDRERLRAADVVFTSAYAPDRVVSEVADLRRTGAIDALAFDLSGPLSELDGRGTAPETIDVLAAAADLFITGEVAARSYLGEPPADAVRTLRDAGAERVAVTAGASGAHLADGTADPVHVPARECDPVDTTGAGDQFTAALIHAWLLGGAGPRAAGEIAAVAAARTCTARGPRGRLATPSELPDQ
ncbi:carbohydrate kinase family protein [Halobellus salinus]|uniref:Carbohydrate kinase family protein n=1 Tax=Halobellus salinus TaxID=931585 RepID=A0A830ETW6_9EURY|nr:carbohydrate kinase family protein [Halobellus salinus]GGJ17412.1 carbohydrate kinase family protein [Halobellus salinus]